MKTLKLFLSLGLMFGMFVSTSVVGFAANYDLIHKTDSSKNTTLTDVLDDDALFDDVADNMSDYYIEYDGKQFELSDYDAKWNELAAKYPALVEGAKIEDAMIFGKTSMPAGVKVAPLNEAGSGDELKILDIF